MQVYFQFVICLFILLLISFKFLYKQICLSFFSSFWILIGKFFPLPHFVRIQPFLFLAPLCFHFLKIYIWISDPLRTALLLGVNNESVLFISRWLCSCINTSFLKIHYGARITGYPYTKKWNWTPASHHTDSELQMDHKPKVNS